MNRINPAPLLRNAAGPARISLLLRRAAWVLIMACFVLLAGCLPETPDVPDQTPAPVVTQSEATQSQPTATDQATTLPSATLPPTQTPTPPPTETPAPTPTPTPTSTPVVLGPTGFPDNVNPLTGLVVADPALLNRLPLLVKVSNIPRNVRPQAGLSSADMVFEQTIGEGSTRFTALYYGQDVELVGPVRSARLVDGSLGQAYNAILAFAGADAFVYQRVTAALGDRVINEGPSTCPALCRADGGDVNSVFGTTTLLTQLATTKYNLVQNRPDLSGMRFESQVPAGGKPAESLEVRYTTITRAGWEYDPESGTYLRSSEDVDAANNVTMVPLMDRNTGEQLAFENVVVMFAQHNELKPTLHEIVMIGNVTGQRALLFRDGQVYELVWKSAGSKPFQFFLPDGSPAPFKPGQTFFQLVGQFSVVTEPTPGTYNVAFYLP